MDRHTPEQRRKNMQAIKNKDSEIECLLRKELWKRGLRYRKMLIKYLANRISCLWARELLFSATVNSGTVIIGMNEK